MPAIPNADQINDDKDYIEFTFGSLCNIPLPQDHTTSWEMLVSKRHITDYNEDGELSTQIPVS